MSRAGDREGLEVEVLDVAVVAVPPALDSLSEEISAP